VTRPTNRAVSAGRPPQRIMPISRKPFSDALFTVTRRGCRNYLPCGGRCQRAPGPVAVPCSACRSNQCRHATR
jgi:hypothetical protein